MRSHEHSTVDKQMSDFKSFLSLFEKVRYRIALFSKSSVFDRFSVDARPKCTKMYACLLVWTAGLGLSVSVFVFVYGLMTGNQN